MVGLACLVAMTTFSPKYLGRAGHTLRTDLTKGSSFATQPSR
jgi:hypothetical protein